MLIIAVGASAAKWDVIGSYKLQHPNIRYRGKARMKNKRFTPLQGLMALKADILEVLAKMRKKSACLFPELVKGSATYEKDIHPYRTIGARNRSFGDGLQSVVGYFDLSQHQHYDHDHNNDE